MHHICVHLHYEMIAFQRQVSFMTDLRGADSLLQKAIKKVDGSKSLDAAQVKCTSLSCDVMQLVTHL